MAPLKNKTALWFVVLIHKSPIISSPLRPNIYSILEIKIVIHNILYWEKQF